MKNIIWCGLLALFAGDLWGQERLNVLFFLVDDLRPSLGCYNDSIAVTPNIDHLAKSALLFNRAYCQQAVCSPSRTSLLTGLRPDATGVTNLEKHFREKLPDLITLPQIFKNNGYFTVGLGKVFHGLPQTLDPVSWTKQAKGYEFQGYLLPENQIGKSKKQNSTEAADVADLAYIDGKIAAEAIALLNEANDLNQPFFVAVGFKKPHAPFVAPKKYWDIYEDVDFIIPNKQKPLNSPEIAYHKWNEIRGYRDIPDQGPIPADKEQELWQGYYACVSYIDAQIGKVIKALDQLGLRDNTIIVLWGDHGYHLGEQQLWCKSTNFELDTRVPLIISVPGAKGAGTKTDAIVETVDIYPTLLDFCGIKSAASLAGISLKSLFTNPQKKWKHVAFSQFVRPYSAIRKTEPTHMGYSVRTEEWRCTYWYDLNNDVITDKELYRLAGDNIEKINVAGDPQYSKVETTLAQLIRNYKNGTYKK